MKIKNIKRGRANRRLQRFSVPQWALNLGEAYAFWYVIHEFVHLLVSGHGHTPYYKLIEKKNLALFDIQIERKRVYPKAVIYRGQRQEL